MISPLNPHPGNYHFSFDAGAGKPTPGASAAPIFHHLSPADVPVTRLSATIDPAAPRAGSTAVLTVLASGSSGGDDFAVPQAPVRFQLTFSPGPDATLKPNSPITGPDGTATAVLKLSATSGDHEIKLTSGAVTTTVVLQPSAGLVTAGRPRHSGVGGSVGGGGPLLAAWLVGAAALLESLVLARSYAKRRRHRGARGAGAVPALRPPTLDRRGG